MSQQKFYLTTPIYYVNARPHIGHAYTTIVADVLARRHRLLGDDTFFLTGTDEHGQKIERSAAAAGVPPQQFADSVSKSFEALWKRMGITNDAYIRTTDEKHKCGVQHLFRELYKNGFIYLASYTGSYCVSDEAFVDSPVGTPCPDCGRLLEEVTEENFFFKLSAFQRPLLDLIESDTIAITPDSRKNEVLSFLRGDLTTLNASQLGTQIVVDDGSQLRRVIEERRRNPNFDVTSPEWQYVAESTAGTRYQIGALKDLSVSRSSFTWGIPVPEPAASAASQKHVIYVWLDALANYMTAIGYGSDDPKDQVEFKRFWPADLHFVGKEIIRFHCVYWPAFLLALNPKLQHKSDEEPPALSLDQHKAWAKEWLPKAITAHGWLLFDNSKMSKSKGNIVRTETILDAFGTLCPPDPNSVILSEGAGLHPAPQSKDPNAAGPAITPGTTSTENPTKADRDLFASDVLRYFLLREIPFGQDGSFSFDALITRYNADLANGYGNLVSRTLKMVQTYSEGTIPAFGDVFITEDVSIDYEEQTAQIIRIGSGRIERYAFIAARVVHEKFVSITFSGGGQGELGDPDKTWGVLDSIASVINHTDLFLTQNAPWKLASESLDENRTKVETILYTAAESIRIITALLYPILPYATARVWAQLGLGDIEAAARNGELSNLTWGGLKPGTKLGPLGPIFPRADKGLAQIMTDMENPTPLITENEQRLAETKQQTTPSTDPGAPPRTTSLNEPAGQLPVAGSTAFTTGPAKVPSHTESTPSAPFDSVASQTPITAGPTDASPQITIDDFAKIELRVAQILVAERIPKADKLLRLEVDLGHEKRQILSGIAEWYTPEELVGRRIVVITNLAPRKMRGLESHGMLLAASDADHGKPHLATCGDEIALGSRLK
ncbi:MAG: methionine--tRNA ligase subunit beta [Acidobacteria bacterium]|nr:methionine--tRNA ligase subunit beta [Acidobacteriota bacterium]